MKRNLKSNSLFICFVCLLITGCQSFEEISMLSESGNPQAQYELSQYYFNGGEKVKKNPKKGFELVLSASESRNADAMFQLGKCYNEGIGTALNKKWAYYWLEEAAIKKNHSKAGIYFGKLLLEDKDFYDVYFIVKCLTMPMRNNDYKLGHDAAEILKDKATELLRKMLVGNVIKAKNNYQSHSTDIESYKKAFESFSRQVKWGIGDARKFIRYYDKIIMYGKFSYYFPIRKEKKAVLAKMNKFLQVAQSKIKANLETEKNIIQKQIEKRRFEQEEVRKEKIKNDKIEQEKKKLAKQKRIQKLLAIKGDAYKYFNFGDRLEAIKQKYELVKDKTLEVKKNIDTGICICTFSEEGRTVIFKLYSGLGIYECFVYLDTKDDTAADLEKAIISKYSDLYGKPKRQNTKLKGFYSCLMPDSRKMLKKMKIPVCKFAMNKEVLQWNNDNDLEIFMLDNKVKINSIFDHDEYEQLKRFPLQDKKACKDFISGMKKVHPPNSKIDPETFEKYLTAFLLNGVFISVERKGLLKDYPKKDFPKCLINKIIIHKRHLPLYNQAHIKIKSILRQKLETEKEAKAKQIKSKLNF